jgi:hypothetical protein
MQSPLQTSSRRARRRRSEVRRIAVHLGKFLGLMAVLWGVFYALHVSFPYIRSGMAIMVETKQDYIRENQLFEQGARVRVAVMGISTGMCGFQPKLFDELSGGRVSSFNVCVPEYTNALADLEAMIANGSPPTHIFVTSPWPEPERPTFFRPVPSDAELVDTLFPFRHMPRDLSIFLSRARFRGGVTAFYRAGREYAEKMLQDRGWYFIEGESVFPDYRLPEDYLFPTDKPEKVLFLRPPQSTGPQWDRFYSLCDAHDITILVVPTYVREKAYRQSAENGPWMEAMKPYRRVKFILPDSFRYPNRLFSDHNHLNPDGAERYTRDLWEVVRPHLFPPATAGEGAG